ncbi:hypothetical protein LZP69_00535 [Shewanella sp. AS1]|uniref:hypothetical protein n=1 Tax=Shewanella sp. AS1 TaxID=2907626 RepID=UPI001F2D6A42|nr:hypothetical protein [Shewanella sp. AS1]MCE9677676.1 hypothetical protein [Shewanella sp. AS1]
MLSLVTENPELTFEERRVASAKAGEHWGRLSPVQRFAFYTLAKLGYQLLFVRRDINSSTAIAKLEDNLATIDDEGEIDFNPDICLRQRRFPREE